MNETISDRTPIRSKPFVVKIATSHDELLGAYKLRYRVFSIEEGDHRYANHQTKTWQDCDDTLSATVFIAVHDNQEIIGTIRYTAFSANRIIAEDKYDFDLLSELTAIAPEQIRSLVAREDRGVVSPEYRSMGVFVELEKTLTEYALSQTKKLLVVAHKATDDRLNKIFDRSGWKAYKTDTYNGFTAAVAYKKLALAR